MTSKGCGSVPVSSGERSDDFQTFEKACAKLPAFARGVLVFAAKL